MYDKILTKMFFKVFVTLLVVLECASLAVASEDAQTAKLETNGTSCEEDLSKRSHEKNFNHNTTMRLKELRLEMRQRRLAAYIIAMDDENQKSERGDSDLERSQNVLLTWSEVQSCTVDLETCEYVADEDKRIEYISGFSGSAGTVVVTLYKAGLWTDGRYSLQAKRQLDSNWFLVVTSASNPESTFENWLAGTLKKNDTVGSDPRNVQSEDWIKWRSIFKKKEIKLVEILPNLVDVSWNKLGRPILGHKPVFILNESFSGKSWQDKILQVRSAMKIQSTDVLVVNKLVNVAWLFNLRGNDIPYTPVFKSYAIVGTNFTRLYVRENIIGDDVKGYLETENCTYDCVELRNYSDIAKDLKELGHMEHIRKVWLPGSVSRYLFTTIPEAKIHSGTNPIENFQAVKNPIEIQGMKNAHLRDSVALVKFLSMLENEVKSGNQWDEINASLSLVEFRSKEKFFMGESFSTISASGENGAVIHYRPTPETNKLITSEQVYLLDSGAQYLDGTTDVTRTLHFGEPTEFQKECYTAVLIGAIRMAKTVFGTYSKDRDFDLIARSALMELGLDYRHGTGHGIGSFLSVHEGPFSISPNKKHNLVTMKPGMFLSDEPGFYYEDENGFGIRLETIVTVVEATTKYNYNNWTYLTFEPVTLVPFERNLIDVNAFTDSELKWLNDYHARVEKEVGDELVRRNETRAYNWVTTRTKFIDRPSKCE